MGRVREKQQERAMTVIPGIISGSTIPSRDTWNEYITVDGNSNKVETYETTPSENDKSFCGESDERDAWFER